MDSGTDPSRDARRIELAIRGPGATADGHICHAGEAISDTGSGCCVHGCISGESRAEHCPARRIARRQSTGAQAEGPQHRLSGGRSGAPWPRHLIGLDTQHGLKRLVIAESAGESVLGQTLEQRRWECDTRRDRPQRETGCERRAVPKSRADRREAQRLVRAGVLRVRAAAIIRVQGTSAEPHAPAARLVAYWVDGVNAVAAVNGGGVRSGLPRFGRAVLGKKADVVAIGR
eukprot:scaffold1452_cov117-Isochrysis_galbana.AAC.13